MPAMRCGEFRATHTPETTARTPHPPFGLLLPQGEKADPGIAVSTSLLPLGEKVDLPKAETDEGEAPQPLDRRQNRNPGFVRHQAASGPSFSPLGGCTDRTVSICGRPSRVRNVIDCPARSPSSAVPTGVRTDTRRVAMSASAG